MDEQTGALLEDRYTICRAVIEAAKGGKIEIVASGLCWVEVCKDPAVRAEGANTLAELRSTSSWESEDVNS